MKELINTRLVAKLMNETAKESGMTRLYSGTNMLWDWNAACCRIGELMTPREADKIYIRDHENKIYGGDEYWEWVRARGKILDTHRRIVKAYDFIAENFLELLTEKVKTEGFDLANHEIKLSDCPVDEIDWEGAKKLYGKKSYLVPLADYPRKAHRMKGGTYVRLLASFKDPRTVCGGVV